MLKNVGNERKKELDIFPWSYWKEYSFLQSPLSRRKLLKVNLLLTKFSKVEKHNVLLGPFQNRYKFIHLHPHPMSSWWAPSHVTTLVESTHFLTLHTLFPKFLLPSILCAQSSPSFNKPPSSAPLCPEPTLTQDPTLITSHRLRSLMNRLERPLSQACPGQSSACLLSQNNNSALSPSKHVAKAF